LIRGGWLRFKPASKQVFCGPVAWRSNRNYLGFRLNESDFRAGSPDDSRGYPTSNRQADGPQIYHSRKHRADPREAARGQGVLQARRATGDEGAQARAARSWGSWAAWRSLQRGGTAVQKEREATRRSRMRSEGRLARGRARRARAPRAAPRLGHRRRA